MPTTPVADIDGGEAEGSGPLRGLKEATASGAAPGTGSATDHHARSVALSLAPDLENSVAPEHR